MDMVIIVLLLTAGFLMLLYKERIIYLIKKYGREKDKILIEDSLKYLYDCEYNMKPCLIKNLSEKLSIKKHETEKLVSKLVELGLIIKKGDELSLSIEGRQNALQIIRIHRLIEKYFAENTGVGEPNWHKIAEEKEHQLNIDEANKIALDLGNPLVDPHGDPIPAQDGTVIAQRTIKLSELEKGITAEIIHIEDEPEEIFVLINIEKLYPGMQLKIKEKNNDKIVVETEGRTISLSRKAAENISVQEIYDKNFIKDYQKTLSSLKLGETAVIIGLSRALRGQQRRRLLDLGIVPGTKIKPVLESIGRDPIAYEVRGTLIALRKNQTDFIFIKNIN